MATKTMTEIGYPGLDAWGGQIREDFLKEMHGKEGYKRYNEMRLNSPIVGALLLAAEQAIRGIEWHYVSDQGDEDPRLEFLENARDNMSHTWNDHITEVLTMLPFGYSPFEICYKRDGGMITWRKFAIRGQDTIWRWLFDSNGGLLGFEQMGAPLYRITPIPIEKVILYRTRVEKNNPEGRSILRQAWVPYYFAKNVQQIEAIGIERDLAGLPMITPPLGANMSESDASSDYSKAHKMVRNVRNDEQAGIVLPPPIGAGDHERWRFELVSTGGTRNFDTNAIIVRHESRILMSALAQFLNLGQDKVGTQSLSTDMTDFWSNAIDAVADVISEAHTEYAMKRLLRLNGMDDSDIRMEHSPAGDVDLGAMADFFSKVGNKITWLPSDELWLRGLAKLPETTIEEIEEERERKAEQQQAMFKQGQQGQQAPGLPPNKMDWLSAGLPPDNDDRLNYERIYENLMSKFFSGQKKRIMKAVK